MMKDFILELYSEEIPARMQKNAENDFFKLISEFFKEFEIEYDNLTVDIGPCRVAFSCNISELLPAKKIELKGPKTDAPEQAIDGFCRSNNINQNELVIQEIKGQQFYFASKNIPAQQTSSIIAAELPAYLQKITWPKSMTWGEYGFAWVRPLKNILCLIGEEIVKLKFAHLEANNITFGHKFMNHYQLEITNKDDYFNKLADNKVIVKRQERQGFIISSLHKICHKLGVTLNEDNKLLEEITGLSEYPIVLYGQIADKFMSLPREVLITSMKNHQKYFTANDSSGNLSPYFLFVCNLELDNYDQIIAGNERVLTARLSDALYFYNLDKSHKLENNLEKLKNVVFHAKLGTLYDKTKRIEKLCSYINESDKDAAVAANLAKCDLVSEMVGEFPELQGIMGGYYSIEQGHNNNIGSAIKNHYQPLGADDEVPSGSAAIVSIADKTDSLVALYLAGERATGSKDPYALRRFALAIIRVVLDNKLDLNICTLLQKASENIINNYNKDLLVEIILFVEERFKYYLRNSFDLNAVNAAINLKRNPFLLSSYSAAQALHNLMQQENGAVLISLYKRANNILGANYQAVNINTSLFETDSEKKLYNSLELVASKVDQTISKFDFLSSLNEILTLKDPLEKFFEENLVNTENENITNNRKALLNKINLVFSKIANFDEF